jgi:hypothetical protein
MARTAAATHPDQRGMIRWSRIGRTFVALMPMKNCLSWRVKNRRSRRRWAKSLVAYLTGYSRLAVSASRPLE